MRNAAGRVLLSKGCTVARNSFEGLKDFGFSDNDIAGERHASTHDLINREAAPHIDPLSPPAIDLVARYQSAPPVIDSLFDGATELEELTPIALKKLREILEEPTDFDQVRMVQAQLSAATTVVNLQVKVDEGRLRRRKVDILPKLLDMIANEENRMSQRVIAGAIIDAELA